jgi:orotate phosphoribosyltransferase
VKCSATRATPRSQDAINRGGAHADLIVNRITELLGARRGHFKMESGHHSGTWFELGSLFDDPATVRPLVAELARRLSSQHPDAVCGPMTGGAKLAEMTATEMGIDAVVAERFETPGATGLFPVRYRIAEAQRAKTRGRRIAIVDDAISAGSAVRGSHADLIECGALPVALGALIVFGDAAAKFAADNGLALEAIERMPFDMWRPAECPLCREGTPLDTAAARSP